MSTAIVCTIQKLRYDSNPNLTNLSVCNKYIFIIIGIDGPFWFSNVIHH